MGQKTHPIGFRLGVIKTWQSNWYSEKNMAELLQEDFLLVLNFFISIIPLAFIISWFCKKNSGSILGAIVIHSIINFTQEFFLVSPYTKCIQTLVLILIAAIFVIADKKVFFEVAEQESA